MVNKQKLAHAVRRAAGITYTEAASCVDVLLETITAGISRGEKIELRGLGSFSIRRIAPRRAALNTAEFIPAHGRVVFRPSRKLRESAWGMGL